jgi:hypothetical protein
LLLATLRTIHSRNLTQAMVQVEMAPQSCFLN